MNDSAIVDRVQVRDASLCKIEDSSFDERGKLSVSFYCNYRKSDSCLFTVYQDGLPMYFDECRPITYREAGFDSTLVTTNTEFQVDILRSGYFDKSGIKFYKR